MSAETNKALSTETAEALLAAIKEAAPDAARRSCEGLESLAEAYATVRTLCRRRVTVEPCTHSENSSKLWNGAPDARCPGESSHAPGAFYFNGTVPRQVQIDL